MQFLLDLATKGLLSTFISILIRFIQTFFPGTISNWFRRYFISHRQNQSDTADQTPCSTLPEQADSHHPNYMKSAHHLSSSRQRRKKIIPVFLEQTHIRYLLLQYQHLSRPVAKRRYSSPPAIRRSPNYPSSIPSKNIRL